MCGSKGILLVPLLASILLADADYKTLLVSGQSAPGTPADVSFADFIAPTINMSGKITFFGQVSGSSVDFSNNYGFWTVADDDVRLLARSGDQAPGAPAGVVFRNL